MAEPIQIPIQIPGGDEAVATLKRVQEQIRAMGDAAKTTQAEAKGGAEGLSTFAKEAEAAAKEAAALAEATSRAARTMKGEAKAAAQEFAAQARDAAKDAKALAKEAKALADAERKAADEAAKAADKLEKETAAAAKKAAEELDKSAKKTVEAFERMRKLDKDGPAPAAERVADSFAGAGRVIGRATTIVTLAAAAFAAAGATIAQHAVAADQDQRAMQALGLAWEQVRAATNDTIAATDAYRAQQMLLNSGLRVSASEFALITRYAREHKLVTETTAEATDRLAQALREGEQGGLRQFGISVTQGATRARTFESALRQMTRATHDASPPQRTLQEETERFGRTVEETGGSLARFVSSLIGLPSIMASLSASLRNIGDDLNYIANEAERASQNRADQHRIDTLRELTQLNAQLNRQAREAGLDPRRLGVRANLNRLTTAQLEARLAEARSLAQASTAQLLGAGAGRGNISTRRGGTGPIRIRSGGEDAPGQVIEAPDLTGSVGATDAEAAAGFAALRAAQATRGQDRGARDRAIEAARLRAGLEALRRGTDADLAAATTTTPTGPRDRAAQGVDRSQERTAKLAQMARDEIENARTEMARMVEHKAQESERIQRDFDEGVARIERDAAKRREEHERSIAGQREAMFNARMESVRRLRAELADLRDPVSQRERMDEMRVQEQVERERRALQQRYEAQRTFTDQMRDLHSQQISSSREAAEGISMAFSKMGEAMAAHIEAFVTGEEDLADALQGMLKDTLSAIGREALTKGGFYFAEGLASLVMYQYDRAATAFGASAAYFAVGGTATALGAAIPAATKPSASGSGGAQRAASVTPRDAGKGDGGTVINVTFGGPMYGTGGVRQAAREISDVLNAGARQGGVALSPALLRQGAGR